MALSKKHFEAIASDFNTEVTGLEQNPSTTPTQASAAKVALRNLAISLCATFRADNPAFDGQRFLRACGF